MVASFTVQQLFSAYNLQQLLNRMSVYDKPVCNKEDTFHIINFYSRKMCKCMRVLTRVCKV